MEHTLHMFICTQCKLLLMIVHTQYHLSQSSEIDDGGDYLESNNSESDYLDTLCPVCSGSSEGIESDIITLKPVELRGELYKDLYRIWNKARDSAMTEDVDGMIFTSAGIPLEDSELKELLTEHLI